MKGIVVTILFLLIGIALIIKGFFQIYGKMIPYSIEASIQGDKLYDWLKINGLINIGWGCIPYRVGSGTS